MKEVNWRRFSLNEKAEALSKYMAELWKVHIFREGNTRTIVTFVCQYTESIGCLNEWKSKLRMERV
ncbi:Fic family protein [Desulfosporosinus burensis]